MASLVVVGFFDMEVSLQYYNMRYYIFNLRFCQEPQHRIPDMRHDGEDDAAEHDHPVSPKGKGMKIAGTLSQRLAM